MFTRRRFILTTLAAVPRLAAAQSFLAPFHKRPVPPQPVFVYFGTDTGKGISKGIYLSRFDPASGLMTSPQLAAETLRPSFLALSPNTVGYRHLYAVNEANDASATITSFLMDPVSGALRLINQVPSAGAGPCYISLDATGEAAFVANYAGSSIASYRVLPSGALSEPVERIDYKNPKFGKRGPNSPLRPSLARQPFPAGQ
jgi:6-phosphogluconolactonase